MMKVKPPFKFNEENQSFFWQGFSASILGCLSPVFQGTSCQNRVEKHFVIFEINLRSGDFSPSHMLAQMYTIHFPLSLYGRQRKYVFYQTRALLQSITYISKEYNGVSSFECKINIYS